MRYFFEAKGEDVMFRRYRDSGEYQRYLDYILNTIGFTGTTRNLRNTYNLFSLDRPNIYFWVTSQLGYYEWTNHSDSFYCDLDDVRNFWNCYHPHLIMGEDLKGLAQELDPDFFKEVTHMVLKDPTLGLPLAKRFGFDLYKISHTRNMSAYQFHLEKICGEN